MVNRKHGATLAAQGIKLSPRRGITPTTARTTPQTNPGRAAAVYGGSQPPVTAQTGSRGYWDALNDTADRTPVPAYAYAIKHVLRGFNRERLALLGDYLYDNDGLVSYAVDTIANYAAPITPMASSPNPEWNKAADDFFAQWSKRADYSGRFTLDDMQRLSCKGIDIRGESAPLMTLENGIPQIQLVETYRIDSRNVSDTSINHIDGVKITKGGAILGYFVRKDQPDSPLPAGTYDFIDANMMMLLYDLEQYSNYRGMTPARRGFNDIRDARDTKGFEKLATKISSALAAVLEGADFEEPNNFATDTGNGLPEGTAGDTGDGSGVVPVEGNPIPSPATEQEKQISTWDLLGGDIPMLPEGRKLKQLDNNRPGERVLGMLDYLGGCFVSGLGLPPSFLIKTKSTGPGERSENGKAQRKFDQRQIVMSRFLQWVWVRVIGWAMATGLLPSQDGWDKIKWQGPSKVSIDEGKDAQQWREDVSQGLMTEQNHFANRNLNWQRENDQIASEIDYKLKAAEKLLVTHPKAPFEAILARLGFAVSPKPAVPPNENKPNETPTPPSD